MLSKGESCGWGRALVPRHWEEGECQGEDRFWEGLEEQLATWRMGFRSLMPSSGQGLTSWGTEKEPQMFKNSTRPPWGLCPDAGSSGRKESRSPPP